MLDTIRKSGIEVVGDVPWGTHFCEFYQSRQDLIDTVGPYILTGLANNEFCMLIASEPLAAPDAEAALRNAVPDFDGYLERHQVEILSYSEWYLEDGSFDARRVLDGWVSKLAEAKARGYEGLRLTGNTFWLEKETWEDFTDYEELINGTIGKYPMMALCTYALDRCGASEVIDVINNHQFALIKRDGRWRVIENSEYKRAAEERERLLAREQAARKEADRQSAQMRTLLASLGEAVVVVDSAGRIVLYNEIAQEICALSERQMQDCLDQRQVPYLNLDGSESAFEDAPIERALRGERFTDREGIWVRPNGTRRRIVASGAAVRDEADSVAMGLVVFRDVTELRRLEQTRDEYVSLVSHDLRNPLTVLTGNVDWLRRLLVKKNLASEASIAENALKSARRMNAMIQDLVESARLESGRLEMRTTLTSLPEFVSDTAERIGTPEDRARLRIETVTSIPPVLVDANRLERALVNLVTNALKFSSADKPVIIQVNRNESEATISVIDEGEGVPPDARPRLFQRFYQTRTGKVANAGGLGLGLYITRLIVEAHGGRIWVASGPSGGCSFTFTLPLA